jgi:hypothetical protein
MFLFASENFNSDMRNEVDKGDIFFSFALIITNLPWLSLVWEKEVLHTKSNRKERNNRRAENCFFILKDIDVDRK